MASLSQTDKLTGFRGGDTSINWLLPWVLDAPVCGITVLLLHVELFENAFCVGVNLRGNLDTGVGDMAVLVGEAVAV